MSVVESKLPSKSALLDDFAHIYGRPESEDDMWQEHIEIDAAPWGANEAYQLKLGGEPLMRFLLCYDSCIVEIDFKHDWELTSEQMAIVGEKLNVSATDKDDGSIENPHFHIMAPIRPIEQNGKRGFRQRRVYELDEHGNHIPDGFIC